MEKRGKGLLLLVGVATLVIIIAIASVIVFTRKPSSQSPPSTNASSTSASSTTTTFAPVTSPQTQASALTQLLQSGPQDRSILQSSIDAIQGSINSGAGCASNVSSAVSEIQQVVIGRQTLLRQLSTTSLSAVPNGTLVIADLRSAWLISKRIDQDFSQWANAEVTDSCHLGDSNVASYRATEVLDPRSTAIKTIFVNLWNPIALQLNQPSTWTADQI